MLEVRFLIKSFICETNFVIFFLQEILMAILYCSSGILGSSFPSTNSFHFTSDLSKYAYNIQSVSCLTGSW